MLPRALTHDVAYFCMLFIHMYEINNVLHEMPNTFGCNVRLEYRCYADNEYGFVVGMFWRSEKIDNKYKLNKKHELIIFDGVHSK